jgi:hypothetical protein
MKTPPRKPNDFGSILYQPFNDAKHSIPYVGTHFQAEPCAESNPRKPTVELHLRAKGIAPVNLGYQVFDNATRLHCHHATTAASLANYLASHSLTRPTPLKRTSAQSRTQNTPILSVMTKIVISRSATRPAYWIVSNEPYTIPAITMQALVESTSIYLSNIRDHKITSNATRFDLDLSIPALFSGIIQDKLPDAHAWKQAYKIDKQCNQLWQMAENPSIATTENLQQIDSIYRAPMRNSQIKIIEDRLCFLEPVAHSTKTVKLIIVPANLRRHVLTCFHVNPIGGHFSLY